MNKDIIKLIYDDSLIMYKGYVDMPEEEFLSKHPMIETVLKSEGIFDPFMLRGHAFTDDVETRWMRMMMPIFYRFLDELSEDEYTEVKSGIGVSYGRYMKKDSDSKKN